jgi:predicted oxidoreductase (fatty acid repression mutant protein)
MLQFAVWTALETEGLGASLQHYNAFGDIFENLVRKATGASDSWKVSAASAWSTHKKSERPTDACNVHL